jgi:hypothetical protein
VNSNIKNLDLNYRKLKISDYEEFRKLFYLCFKKKISYNFFKWRYFNNKFSFCYGVFVSSKLIANVGMVSIKLNNKKNEIIFSRHSSMVLKKYRGFGIFSNLLENVKNKIFNKTRLVVMWPNKNNFSNFGIDKKNIIKKTYYLYKTSKIISLTKKTKNYHIDELTKFQNYIENSNNFFLKDFAYFKDRYLSYQKQEYLINKFEFKKSTSFFILKRNKDKSGLNYVILDHFGCKKINSKHLSYLISDQNKLVFLSKSKINKSNYKLINCINFKIGFIKKYNIKEKKTILFNKEIFLGDTDIFITTDNHNK